jgi:hypothetical protein
VTYSPIYELFDNSQYRFTACVATAITELAKRTAQYW